MRVKYSRAVERRRGLLKESKGFFGANRKRYRIAKPMVERAMANRTESRKNLKRSIHSLWIIRLNAFARKHSLSYSKLLALLKLGKIGLNRKMLSYLAVSYPEVLERVIQSKERVEEKRYA